MRLGEMIRLPPDATDKVSCARDSGHRLLDAWEEVGYVALHGEEQRHAEFSGADGG